MLVQFTIHKITISYKGCLDCIKQQLYTHLMDYIASVSRLPFQRNYYESLVLIFYDKYIASALMSRKVWRYQRDYQNLNLHNTIQWSQEDTKAIIRDQIYTRQYNGHKKIPKRLPESKSTQDNTMVARRYQRDYHNLNLHKTIQWSQEDTKELIKT